jgi:hypothetical protein
MKVYGGVDAQIHVFLISALLGSEQSALPTERVPSTHWIGGWVDPRTGLDYVKKRKILLLLGLKLCSLGHQASHYNCTILAPPT